MENENPLHPSAQEQEKNDLTPEEQTQPTPHRTARAFFDYLEIFAYAVFGILLVFSFVFRLCRVNGPSMDKTLADGEMLMVSNINYKPQQGDIIVFHQTGDTLNEPLVKRVIATGGQKVAIDFKTGRIYIDDVELEEDYDYIDNSYFSVGIRHSEYAMPVVVPEGCLFVMGDNRNNSTDSRSLQIYFVDERRVIGKVLYRVTPISRFGSLYTEADQTPTTESEDAINAQ